MKYNNTPPVKARWQLPAPEEIVVGAIYCFTLNINDTKSGILYLHPRYQAMLQKISEFCDVDMYYELSKKNKWHQHGWLSFRENASVIPFYGLLNDSEVKETFTYCLKEPFDTEEVDGYKKWSSYIIKQKHYSKPYLRKFNINYHTQISDEHPIGEVYKYITSSQELKAELDN